MLLYMWRLVFTISVTTLASSCVSAGHFTEDDFAARNDVEQDAKERIQHWVGVAKLLVNEPGISNEQINDLTAAIDATRSALSNYDRRRSRGAARAMIIAPIRASAGAIVADNATGIGVGNDVLLVPLALAAVAAYAITDARASSDELGQAWNSVLSTSGELGTKVDVVLSALTAVHSGERPPRDDCIGNIARCLGTRLGDRGTGRSPGHSICADCLEVCQGDGTWPVRGRDGKDCRWWIYE